MTDAVEGAEDSLANAVRDLRARGVEFMTTPPTYYDALPERLRALDIDTIDEDIGVLRELQLLVDGHGLRSYLLQESRKYPGQKNPGETVIPPLVANESSRQ